MVGLPTGTVTFLFTDLANSTRLWEEYPEAMKDASARHDTILRDAVRGYHGHVVKMTGDGMYAVFASATDAVEASVAAQQALCVEPWGETGPLRVRMGLHTGEADQREGDYFGTTLNRTARLMGIGHGGQVLMSAATADLVVDHQPWDIPHTLVDGIFLLAYPSRRFQSAWMGIIVHSSASVFASVVILTLVLK